MKKSNSKNSSQSSKSIVSNNGRPQGIHKNGYRPSGPNTSSDCTPPNIGSSVNKHK